MFNKYATQEEAHAVRDKILKADKKARVTIWQGQGGNWFLSIQGAHF
jgi:hypothetical protein